MQTILYNQYLYFTRLSSTSHVPVFYLIDLSKSCASVYALYYIKSWKFGFKNPACGCFQYAMTFFLAVCVVLLHYQISTSNKVDNGHHVSPILSRHIRSALPADLKKSPSIDSQPPQWLQHYCFGQPAPSSAGMRVWFDTFIDSLESHLWLQEGNPIFEASINVKYMYRYEILGYYIMYFIFEYIYNYFLMYIFIYILRF